MSLEREQSHDSTSSSRTDNDHDEHAPGRASRSALLRKPDHAIASGLLSRKARDANGVAEGAEDAVAAASSSSGSALPDSLMRKFESSLGADLSGVRVHTGSESAAANDAVGARAYTMGNDIHFGAGQYDPHSASGEHLIAHEVAHTVQQSGGASRVQFKLDVSSSGDAHEIEADRAADAMVSGASFSVGGGGQGLHRKETTDPKAPAIGEAHVPAHELTKEEKKDLDWCKTVAGKAYKDYVFAADVLDDYAIKAPRHLAKIKSTFETTIARYKSQFQRVNNVIEKAKENAAIRNEILTSLVSTAFSGLMGKAGEGILSKVTGKAKGLEEALGAGYKELFSHLSTLQGHASDLAGKAGLTKAALKAAGAGGGDAGGAEDPMLQELAFWKSFSALQSRSDGLFRISSSLAKAGPDLGRVQQKIEDMIDAGKTDPKYPIKRLRDNSSKLQSACDSLAGSAEGVPDMLSSLATISTQATTSAPKDDLAVEKELWVKWAAGLDGTDKDTMDLDVIEKHLKKLGIWDQLGINPGNFFSDADQTLAVCSANAQTRVLAHKGELVNIGKGKDVEFGGLALGKAHTVKLGDLPELAAIVEGGATTKNGSAIVVGAKAVGQLPKDILDKHKGKETITEVLLKQGHIAVIVRPYAEKIDDPALDADS